jgi:hypothetical protein
MIRLQEVFIAMDASVSTPISPVRGLEDYYSIFAQILFPNFQFLSLEVRWCKDPGASRLPFSCGHVRSGFSHCTES